MIVYKINQKKYAKYLSEYGDHTTEPDNFTHAIITDYVDDGRAKIKFGSAKSGVFHESPTGTVISTDCLIRTRITSIVLQNRRD